VALPKVYGIETEYGIRHAGVADPNPIAASSVLINAYLNDLGARAEGRPVPAERVGWDFEDEHPGSDARGFTREGSLPPEVETHLVNAVLTNGARYYVDHAHPEYSSPECSDPLQATLYDAAGERIAIASMAAAKRQLPPGQELVVLKNNSDRKGNSYGTHENYLMDRTVPFAQVVRHVLPYFVTRGIFTGAGKVGTESPTPGLEVPFQLTQRADFFEEEVGLETTLKRPIVNTRDEPHADASKYRRLHVILGDANRSQVQTFLKLGVTGLVLCMIEDDWLGAKDLTPAAPVQALRRVSYDLTLRQPIELADGSSMTALEVQWEYLDLARKWADEHGLDAIGGDVVGREVLRRWEEVLTGLEGDPMALAGQLDWVAKLKLFEAYRERDGLSWGHAKLAQLDLVYHDLRPEKDLAAKLGLEQLVSVADAERAATEPPRTTRAWFRGRCLARFPGEIAAANWDSMVFDLGGEPLKRVAMMEPLRGTADIVGEVLEGSSSAAELLRRLGA
jgi:proteasome accessory factor A